MPTMLDDPLDSDAYDQAVADDRHDVEVAFDDDIDPPPDQAFEDKMHVIAAYEWFGAYNEGHLHREAWGFTRL
jgi:hypothetical protein